MGNLNKVMLIGRLGADPEIKKTQKGTSVVTVSLATSRKFKNSVENTETETEWHRVTFWTALADNLCNYTKKGSLLYVEGRLQTREWTKDDVRRFTTEIIAERMQFLDSKKDFDSQQSKSYSDNSQPSQTEQEKKTNYSTAPQDDDFVDDDVPF